MNNFKIKYFLLPTRIINKINLIYKNRIFILFPKLSSFINKVYMTIVKYIIFLI